MSPGLGHCQGLTMLDWRERGREGGRDEMWFMKARLREMKR